MTSPAFTRLPSWKSLATGAACFALALGLTTLLAPAAQAQPGVTYQVTITNITYNQIIGPPVIASHTFRTRVFTPGGTASDGLAAVAEDADFTGLVAELTADPEVLDVANATGPLLPGESVTLEITAGGPFGRLSAIGMLVTTNDAFFGLNNFQIREARNVVRLQVPAYDSGTEGNNELCEFIPGPPCGNAFVRDLEGAEGFIHLHRGFHGVGDLPAASYDWRNPVAEILITNK